MNESKTPKTREEKIEYSRLYRLKNHEKILERERKFREAHREERNARNREYAANNKDKLQKKYRDNIEHIKERRSEMLICECGREVQRHSMTRHLKSSIHERNLPKSK